MLNHSSELRKLSKGSRSRSIASLLATLRTKGMNMLVETDKMLRREQCGFG